MRSWKKEFIGIFCLLLAVCLFCAGASAVLIPKRHDTGAIWGMYEAEPKNSVDVLFLGSSLAYCDVVPSVVYQQTGIASFVMAGPDQSFPLTYRYLRQACKTQSPKVVFVEATGLFIGKNRSSKVNIAYMPWGPDRLAATFQEAEPEERTGLLFPLYAYHDRWDKLEPADYKEGLLGYEPDPLAGYMFLDRARSRKELETRDCGHYEDCYPRNLECAKKMMDFCRERNISLVFYMAPNIARLRDDLLNMARNDLVSMGAEYWDLGPELNKMDIDLTTDFYDLLHLNYRGADKFSRYMAGRLEIMGLAPSENCDRSLWEKRVEHFAALRREWDERPIRSNPAGEGGTGD